MPKVHDPAETFFHLRIVDAELGNIRFGPFTLKDAAAYVGAKKQEVTFEDLGAKLVADIEKHGVCFVLDQLEINFGYTVFLSGDPSQNVKLFEKELS